MGGKLINCSKTIIYYVLFNICFKLECEINKLTLYFRKEDPLVHHAARDVAVNEGLDIPSPIVAGSIPSTSSSGLCKLSCRMPRLSQVGF